jgi:O-antigen ligase
MFHRKVIPEDYTPGRVAFTDYVPLFIFFYVISLVPFSDSESEHFSYALLTTIPQQFILGFAERYCNWYGQVYYFINRIPIVDIFIGPYGRYAPTSATLYNPNMLALYGSIGVAISIGIILKEFDKVKVLGKNTLIIWIRILFVSACFILSLILMVWTNSRAGWAAIIYIIICYAIVHSSRRFFKTIGVSMLFITILLSTNLGQLTKTARFIVPSGITERFTYSSQSPFLHERMDIYECAVNLIKERPIEGWGLGMLTAECSQRTGHYVCHAHDLFLQLAAEIGLPFTILIVCLVFYIFISSLLIIMRKGSQYTMHNLDAALLIAVSVVLLMQIFDLALLMTYRLNFLFWICFAILYSRSRQLNSMEKRPYA